MVSWVTLACKTRRSSRPTPFRALKSSVSRYCSTSCASSARKKVYKASSALVAALVLTAEIGTRTCMSEASDNSGLGAGTSVGACGCGCASSESLVRGTFLLLKHPHHLPNPIQDLQYHSTWKRKSPTLIFSRSVRGCKRGKRWWCIPPSKRRSHSNPFASRAEL